MNVAQHYRQLSERYGNFTDFNSEELANDLSDRIPELGKKDSIRLRKKVYQQLSPTQKTKVTTYCVKRILKESSLERKATRINSSTTPKDFSRTTNNRHPRLN